jgi:hypothetical protein
MLRSRHLSGLILIAASCAGPAAVPTGAAEAFRGEPTRITYLRFLDVVEARGTTPAGLANALAGARRREALYYILQNVAWTAQRSDRDPFAGILTPQLAQAVPDGVMRDLVSRLTGGGFLSLPPVDVTSIAPDALRSKSLQGTIILLETDRIRHAVFVADADRAAGRVPGPWNDWEQRILSTAAEHAVQVQVMTGPIPPTAATGDAIRIAYFRCPFVRIEHDGGVTEGIGIRYLVLQTAAAASAPLRMRDPFGEYHPALVAANVPDGVLRDLVRDMERGGLRDQSDFQPADYPTDAIRTGRFRDTVILVDAPWLQKAFVIREEDRRAERVPFVVLDWERRILDLVRRYRSSDWRN